MSRQSELKKSFKRVFNALHRTPALGQRTHVSTTVIDGLACEIHEDGWRLKVDMPTMAGGQLTAPTPGVLGRAALGSCLAIGYMLRASSMDIPLASLEVDILADSDDGGLYGSSAALPGYSEVRYRVRIVSPAAEERVMAMLDEADRHSPWLDVFSRPVVCKREVQLTKSDIPGGGSS